MIDKGEKMYSLMILSHRFFLILASHATILYIGILIALTIIRFGLKSISTKNLIMVATASRTMRVLWAIYLVIILLWTVDGFFFKMELNESIELNRRQYNEWKEEMEKWNRINER